MKSNNLAGCVDSEIVPLSMTDNIILQMLHIIIYTTLLLKSLVWVHDGYDEHMQ